MYVFTDSNIIKYDLNLGTVKKNINDISLSSNSVIFSNMNHKDLYVYDKGIYALNNNKLIEKIDYSNTELSDIYKSVVNIILLKNNEYLVAYNTGNIYKYYTKKEKKSNKDNLSIYSLYYSDYLDTAITRYSKKNNINIEYNYGIDQDSSITENDAIKTLNTEIKANKGPDIFILDNLPMDSYIKQGYLEDISDIYNDVSDKVFDNILKSSFKGKKLYYMPFSFRIPMISGKNIDNISDINSLNKFIYSTNTTDNIMNFDSLEEFVDYFYSLYGSDIIGNDNTLNIKKTKKFLVNCKKLYDHINIKNQYNTDETLSEKDLLYRNGYFYTFAMDKKPFIEVGSISDVYSYSALLSLKTTDNINSHIFGDSNSNIFFPSDLMALNSASKNKKQAKEFIEAMFKMDRDNNNYLGDTSSALLCTNKSMFEDGLKKSALSDILFMKNDKSICFSGIKFSDSNINNSENLIKKLNKGKIVNEQILKLINDDVDDYILGKEDISTCISDISNNLELYLSE